MTSDEGNPVEGRRVAAAALVVFLVCLAVYLPTVSREQVNTDAGANSLAAWHLAQTGKPWMDGLDLSEPGEVSHFGPGRDGHMVTTRTPGQIWAAAPFYLGSSDRQEEWSWVPGGIAAATLTAGAMALLFLGLRRSGLGLPTSLGATAILAFTTPVWAVSADALWTHPVTVLGIAGAIWALARDRWGLAGIWFAVGMFGRPHIALIAAVVGVGMAWSRRSSSVAVKVAVPTLSALLALSAWSYYVFGTWDPRGAYEGHEVETLVPGVGQGGGSGYWTNLAGFLVAPDRGVLVWTPLLVVLLAAVVRGWRSAPDWTRWLAVGGVVYSLGQVGLNVFHGGDSFFGYRHALELVVCVTPLYAHCSTQAGRLARAFAPVVIGLQFGSFALGSVMENITLPYSEVWTDNSVWRYAVDYPTSFGVAFGALTLVGGLVAHLAIQRTSEIVQGVPEPLEHV